MIDWQSFQFLRPEALIGLLVLPLISLVLFKLKQNQTQWRSYIPSHLQAFLLVESKHNKRSFQYWLLGFIWCVSCLALAGPTWEKLPQPVYQSQSGKVILADMSLSMRATDVTPDRLTRLRFKALDLLDLIDDGEVGLVAYAGDAFTISPLTEDVENIKNLIPSLSPEIMPVLGSNPFAALMEAKQLLENAGYAQGDIYWLTDGIAIEDIELIREFIDQNTVRISVLLVGTEQGAPITQADGTLLKDRVGNIVIPKVDPYLFTRALVKSDASVVKMRADDGDIKAMVLDDDVFSREIENSEEQRSGDLWKDMGGYVVLLLLPLVALLFRKGLVFCLFIGLWQLSPTEAFAQSQNDVPVSTAEQLSTVDSLFLNKNQRAEKHFQNEAYQQAQEQFVDKDWKAAAAYKAGDYATAGDLYGQLEGTQNLYNLGNSLAMQGQLQEAISTYAAVLEREPDHGQAKTNKDILEALLEQQQEQNGDQNQQSQDEQSQDQKSQDQQQQNQNSSDDNQSSDQQQSQDNQQQEQSQQQSQSSQNQQSENNAQQPQHQDNQQQQEQQSQQQEQQASNQPSTSDEEQQQQAQDSVVQGNIDPSQMTPEEREKMRQMQMLLNKIPDDPAFLLKRKMLVESQQRQRQGAPLMQQQIW